MHVATNDSRAAQALRADRQQADRAPLIITSYRVAVNGRVLAAARSITPEAANLNGSLVLLHQCLYIITRFSNNISD